MRRLNMRRLNRLPRRNFLCRRTHRYQTLHHHTVKTLSSCLVINRLRRHRNQALPQHRVIILSSRLFIKRLSRLCLGISRNPSMLSLRIEGRLHVLHLRTARHLRLTLDVFTLLEALGMRCLHLNVLERLEALSPRHLRRLLNLAILHLGYMSILSRHLDVVLRLDTLSPRHLRRVLTLSTGNLAILHLGHMSVLSRHLNILARLKVLCLNPKGLRRYILHLSHMSALDLRRLGRILSLSTLSLGVLHRSIALHLGNLGHLRHVSILHPC